MSRRIRILPDSVANQIAAGEVVERPASVVKELVENALDAAATRVEVGVRSGGKGEIRVADDGTGMGREDALLALDRHATSKIQSAGDLARVRSFGFRGEALPSIASVARLTLESAEAGSVGTRVRAEGGRVVAVEECARQPGTTVTVKNLFFNTPARAKFLKSAGAETRAIADVVTVMALAHLSTTFELESNGRAILDLPAAGDLATRAAALWGDAAAAALMPLDHAQGDVRVAGLVERPDAAVSGPRRLHLFVHGRPFRDRGLVHAAERAYRTTVAHGVRPTLLLYLDVPDGAVDVNVHPAKAEVRFRERAAVEEAVEAAVHAALQGLDSAATMDRRPARPQLRGGGEAGHAATVARPPGPGQLGFFAQAATPAERIAAGDEGDAGQPAAGDAAVAAGGEGNGAVTYAPAVSERARVAEPDPSARVRPTLWQVHRTWILAETRGGLLIIDQHSAHERILFEELMRGFAGSGREAQRLLFPITLRLSPAEYSVVEGSHGLFARAGFEVEPFGGRTVIVHAVPNPHPWFDAERCLREMITELAEGSELTRAARNQHERIAMTFACKGAIKAGQRLSPEEMQELFDRLFATELPSHDVHGRPTIVRLPVSELERRFGRA